jgi:hypothetical protein
MYGLARSYRIWCMSARWATCQWYILLFFRCDGKAYVDLIVGRAVLFLQFLAVNVDSDALSRVDLQSRKKHELVRFFFNGNLGGFNTYICGKRCTLA